MTTVADVNQGKIQVSLANQMWNPVVCISVFEKDNAYFGRRLIIH